MDDSGSTPRPAASTGDLARLRAQRPAWHIRHASDDHPGQLGYLASRDAVLITAENLVRLGDRIADADRSADPPAALKTGPPGWNSGPMPDLTAADLAAAVGPRGWEIAEHGGHLTAEHKLGTILRVLAGRTPAELAVKIADAEAAMPGPDPAGALAEVAADHPTWTIAPAASGHGVEATRADVALWAYNTAELSALLDVADPQDAP